MAGFGKGLLIGSVVGFATALLYTPKSGPQMRKDLRTRVHEMRGTMSTSMRRLAKESRAVADDIAETVDPASGRPARRSRG
jgi:gas vesicle protein